MTIRYSLEDLVPNGENDFLFGNIVKSDGFCVDFVFYRRAINRSEDSTLIKNHDISVDDFSIKEVEHSYKPSFLDPGRKSVYTAVKGLSQNEHEIRRCSVKEYYHLTGSTVYSKRLQQEKDAAGITQIESVIPTAKTARNISFLRFADYMLSHIDRLFAFYGFHSAKSRFNLYQGKQRAPQMMVQSTTGKSVSRRRTRNNSENIRKRKKGNNNTKGNLAITILYARIPTHYFY